MKKDILDLAVMNNAFWCNTICDLHNVPCEFLDMFWVAKEKVPVYYPNIITLKRLQNSNDGFEPFQQVLRSIPLNNFSIKDSFNELPLSTLNFRTLFEAEWIAFTGTSRNLDSSDWFLTKDIEDVIDWDKKLFLPQLLNTPNIYFIIKRKENRIVAGAILNQTKGVVGISNVFHHGNDECWKEMICFIRRNISVLPIVGYEKDTELVLAQKAGFEKLGKLKIWIK